MMDKEAFQNIKLIIMDVDGVLTDGQIYLGPGYMEIKGFCSQDGIAVKMAHFAGMKTALISGRKSEAVMHRAKEINIEELYLGVTNKLSAFNQLLTKLNLTEDQVCYIGDDIVDLSIMRKVALPIAVGNAVDAVKSSAKYETVKKGGYGAVREAIEYILRKQGFLDEIIDHFAKL